MQLSWSLRSRQWHFKVAFKYKFPVYIYHLITPTSLVGLRKLIITLLIFSNSSCSVERTRISDMSSLKDKAKAK